MSNIGTVAKLVALLMMVTFAPAGARGGPPAPRATGSLLPAIALLTRGDTGGQAPGGTPAADGQQVLDAIEAIAAPPSDAPAHEREIPPRNADVWVALARLFWPTLLMAGAIGVACAVVGVFVLLRGEALFALALPQWVAVGAAVGLRLGWPTFPPALMAVGLWLVCVAGVRGGGGRRRQGGGDLLVPATYVAGLCLSFLLIAGSGQHLAELQNLYTGIDVAVTPARALVAAPLLLGVALLCAVLWRRWLLIAQVPTTAELAGVRPARWDALFLSLAGLALLTGIDSQGIVMVLAMTFLAPAIVLPWVARVPAALVAAPAVALAMLAIAFVASNAMAWPLSHSVGGAGFALLVLSQVARRAW
jgi:ABC-type Mn2+/Zn2+ transport system permease subunit